MLTMFKFLRENMALLYSTPENFFQPSPCDEQNIQVPPYSYQEECFSWSPNQQEESWSSSASDDSENDSGIFISGNDVVLSSGNVVTPTATATMAGRRSSEIATSQILTELNQAQIHESIISGPPNWHHNVAPHHQQEDAAFNDIEVSEDELEMFDIEESYFKNEDFHIMEPADPLPSINSILDAPEFPSCSQQQTVMSETQTQQEQPSYDFSDVKCETTDEEYLGHGRKETRKLPILSQFLVEALENPDEYRHMIRWVDRKQGVFEFNSKNKEEFAKMWGVAKHNRCPMSYQKMSRALRIYIKKEKVLRKMRRKLQYVFRPEFIKKELKRRESLMST